MRTNTFLNADDFGMNKATNVAIKKAILAKQIRSVSVMTTGSEFRDAVTFLRKHREILVGLHFDITEAAGLGKMAFKLLFDRRELGKVARALDSQYQKLYATGLHISHIDSHEHIHAYPPIFKMVATFAKEHGVSRIRHCEPRLSQILQLLSFDFLWKKYLILGLYYIDFYLFKADILDRSMVHIADSGWLRHFTSARWEKLITRLGTEGIERICHLY